MGGVYLVRHPALDTEFALKVLPTDLAEKDGDFVKRFMREAKIACRIRHPSLVSVHDAGFDEVSGLYYFVMDYVDGGSLSRKLKASGGRLTIDEALRITREIAAALSEAAKHGMVHRDIKPANIMFDGEGRPRLCDLGLAKASGINDSLTTKTEAIFGTPAYMSPEQMSDSGAVDCRADIYSLGVVLFEMLAGRRPFEGESTVNIMAKVISPEPAPEVTQFRKEVPAPVAALVRSMCEKKVSRRIASAAEVVSAIDTMTIGGGGVGAQNGSRRGLTVAMAVIALAAVGVAVAFFKNQDAQQPAVDNVPPARAAGDGTPALPLTNDKESFSEEMRLVEEQAKDESETKRLAEAESKRVAEEKRLAEEKAKAEAEAMKPIEYRFSIRINNLSEEQLSEVARALADAGAAFVFAETGRQVIDEGGWGRDKLLSLAGDLTISAPRNAGPDARRLLIDFLQKRNPGDFNINWNDPLRIATRQDFSTFSTRR